MYERSAEGWAKHLDFILLDMICLEISLALGYMLRHGWLSFVSQLLTRKTFWTPLIRISE